MGVVAERALFATKGRAAPGLVELAGPDAAPAAGRKMPDSGQQPPLPLADEPAAGGGHPSRAETPAGSLLDFRLRGGTARAALTDDIRAALKPRPEAVPVATPGMAETEPAARPAPSTRLDRPLFPQEPRAPQRRRVEPAISAPAPAPVVPASVVPAPVPPQPSVWRTVVPALTAIVGIAVVGWVVANSDMSELASVADAGVAPVQAAAESIDATGTEALAAAAPAALAPSAPAVHPEGEAAAAAITAPAGDSLPAALEMPSFDIVRVTPDAPPVVAGRAAPGTELIVLDNGTPLGTVVADANGEWALVSDSPLSPGRHELSLAITTSEGTVVIEQAETAPVPAAPAAPALPTPGEKPAADAAGAAPHYLVQLASVPATADAQLEWTRLQSAYPALLAGRDAEIAAAEIGGRGTFYRVRTGPFDGRNAARELCQALNAAGQECLVVREATP